MTPRSVGEDAGLQTLSEDELAPFLDLVALLVARCHLQRSAVSPPSGALEAPVHPIGGEKGDGPPPIRAASVATPTPHSAPGRRDL